MYVDIWINFIPSWLRRIVSDIYLLIGLEEEEWLWIGGYSERNTWFWWEDVGQVSWDNSPVSQGFPLAHKL